MKETEDNAMRAEDHERDGKFAKFRNSTAILSIEVCANNSFQRWIMSRIN